LSDLTGNSSDYIDWSVYANNVIEICEKNDIKYMIKDALKKFM